MAKIDVIMPQMGESIAEGTLSRWMKKVGDAVKRDEPIFEISHRQGGRRDPRARRGRAGGDPGDGGPDGRGADRRGEDRDRGRRRRAPRPAPAPAGAAAAAPAAPAAAPSAPAAARKPRRRRAAARAGCRRRPRAQPPRAGAEPRAARSPARNGGESAEERLRRRSTPLVRKMAAEHNLDLSAIPGTGLAGRVTKNDILSYLETGPRRPPKRPAAAAARRRRRPRPPAAPPPAAPAHAPARRALARRPGRAVVADPEAHRRAHGDVAAGLAARQHDLRDRLHPRGAAPGQEEEGIRRPGREPDLPRVHREGGGRRPAAAPGA